MRIIHFENGAVPGIAADDGSGWHGVTEPESGFPGTLPELIAKGADLLRTGMNLLPMHAINLNAVRILLRCPGRRRFSVSDSITMITSRKAASKSQSIPKFLCASQRV